MEMETGTLSEIMERYYNEHYEESLAYKQFKLKPIFAYFPTTLHDQLSMDNNGKIEPIVAYKPGMDGDIECLG